MVYLESEAIARHSAAGNEVEMETAFLPAAIIWGALSIGLACIVIRLRGPQPGAEPPQEGSAPAAEVAGAGD